MARQRNFFIKMIENQSHDQFNNVLALIEEVHKAKTKHEFRQRLIHGVGSLMPSNSCVWTEFHTDVFESNQANTVVAEISDDTIDTAQLLPVFNAYAYQHPVIAHVLRTNDTGANALSDKIERTAFHELELYKQFYNLQGIEDQLTIAYIENDCAKGLSIHRDYWGFTPDEHQLAERIAHCTFAYYRALSEEPNTSVTTDAPVIQINAIDFEQYHDVLGVTQRQAAILNQVATGHSNKQIASVLELSEGTVRKHLENCFRRLGVNNRVSAIIESIALIANSSKITRQDH